MADSPGPSDPRPEDEAGDSLEGALRIGFGSDSVDARRDAELALAAVQGPVVSSSQLLLRDPPEEQQPVMKPLTAGTRGPPRIGRYQMLGELGRGGMGTVMKGRDTDLGREVALKVLSDRHSGDAERVRRFVEEAQIGGQLQHPGIVPVYEMGVGADRKPYFAMKLVNGQTLAALLEARRDPRDDQRRFLTIFEQVCQTMAYAHARGVIHRDLKPSNVMVGAFAEVQVVDWGLAKVLACGGVEDERRAKRSAVEPELVETVRSRSTGSESRVGSVMGTLAYMPPEQARGEVADLDERSDIFSLGAILCEILTGKAPYIGETADDVRDQAERGSIGDAIARLEASGADEHILRIAKKCLAPSKRDRLRDAGVLARNFTSYMRSVEERLRAAELARTAAEAKATVEIRARQLTVALAGSILVLLLLIGGGYWWVDTNRRTHARETALAVEDLLSEAALLHGQARISPVEDLSRWELAISTAKKAKSLAVTAGADAPICERVEALLATLEQEYASAQARATQRERDLRTVKQLEEIRLKTFVEDLSTESQVREYEEVFRAYGIDVVKMDSESVVKAIRAREISVRLAVALDEWAEDSRKSTKSEEWKSLSRIAREADPDPWRNRRRDAFYLHDINGLRELASSPELIKQSPITIDQFADSVGHGGSPDLAVTLYRKAVEVHPGDFWLNIHLAHFLLHHAVPPLPEEAVGFARAGLAVRSESVEGWLVFADALCGSGDFDGALRACRWVVERNPDLFKAHFNLGQILRKKGSFDEAITSFREAIRLRPRSPRAHVNLGIALGEKGQLDDAITSFREAIRVKPDSALGYSNLGFALGEKGLLDDAIAAYRAAIRLEPDDPEAHTNLGTALSKTGLLDDAIVSYREAIRLGPKCARAHVNLGITLRQKGLLEEAMKSFREAIRFKPDLALAHFHLGISLARQGLLDEAISSYREAIRLGPEDAAAHYNLGLRLSEKGFIEEAMASYREAIRLEPDDADAHCNLGNVQKDKGVLDEAMASYREAIRLKPDLAKAHCGLGNALAKKGVLDDAITSYREAIRLQPEFANAHHGLAIALRRKGLLDEAIASYREAIRLEPEDAAAPYNLGIALAAKGLPDEAIASYREAIRLEPEFANAHSELGFALAQKGLLDEAITSYREAIRLKPDLVEAHGALGTVLIATGLLDGAVAEFQRVQQLAPDRPLAADALELVLHEKVNLARAARLVAEGRKPETASEQAALASVLARNQRFDVAAYWFAEAFSVDPELVFQFGTPAAKAALAASHHDVDGSTITLRTNAVGWLELVLRRLEQDVASDDADPALVTATLAEWLMDPTLVSTQVACGTPASSKLVASRPTAEHMRWERFWSDVHTLRAQIRRR